MADKSPSIAAIIHVLTHREEFEKAVVEMTLLQEVETYAALHFIEELSKSRREVLRKDLLERANAGEPTEKGGFKLSVGEHLVLKEKRTPTLPDETKLMELLVAKNLASKQAFDEVKILVPNPSKVALLVDTGHLTEDEAKALYKSTWALVVKESSDLGALLESSVPASTLPAKKPRR